MCQTLRTIFKERNGFRRISSSVKLIFNEEYKLGWLHVIKEKLRRENHLPHGITCKPEAAINAENCSNTEQFNYWLKPLKFY